MSRFNLKKKNHSVRPPWRLDARGGENGRWEVSREGGKGLAIIQERDGGSEVQQGVFLLYED